MGRRHARIALAGRSRCRPAQGCSASRTGYPRAMDDKSGDADRHLRKWPAGAPAGILFAFVCACLFGGLTISCWFAVGPFQACMRDGMHGTIGYALQGGALLVGIWIGSETREWTGRPWPGWVVGACFFFGVSGLLIWLGFPARAA